MLFTSRGGFIKSRKLLVKYWQSIDKCEWLIFGLVYICMVRAGYSCMFHLFGIPSYAHRLRNAEEFIATSINFLEYLYR